MKKQLLVTSLISSMLLLSACGGGSDDNNTDGSSNGNPNITENFYSFDYDYQEDKNTYGFETEKLDVKNGEFTITPDALENYVLTQKELYEPGYKFTGKSQVNSLTNWTVYDFPGVGAKLTFEPIVLTNQNVYDTVLPGYKNYLAYLSTSADSLDAAKLYAQASFLNKTNPNEKFGSGTRCLRIQKIAPLPNSYYFSFDTYSEVDATYEEQLESLNSIKKLETKDNQVNVSNGTWAGYRWLRIKTDYKNTPNSNEDIGFVEVDGQLYEADVENGENIDIAASLVQIKQLLKDSTDKAQRAEIALIIAAYENGCSAYNVTAAEQITKYIR